MTKYLFKNNATGALASGITSLDTEMSLGVGEGAFFPNPVSGEAFRVTVQSGTVFEIMECTGRSGDILTVVRAREGTSARAWSAGASVDLRITAEVMEAVRDNTTAIQALAALTPASNKIAYYSGSATASLATLTAYGRTLIAVADAAAGRTALGLGNVAVQDVTGSVVGDTDAQTLTNKTLDAANFTGVSSFPGDAEIDGSGFMTVNKVTLKGAANALHIFARNATAEQVTPDWSVYSAIGGLNIAYQGSDKLFVDNSGDMTDPKGYIRAVPQNPQGAYTLAKADRGKHILASGNITVPTGVFAIGDAIVIVNNTASNITIGGSATLKLAATTSTGTRTLTGNGVATLLCVGTDTFICTGAGLA